MTMLLTAREALLVECWQVPQSSRPFTFLADSGSQ